MDARELNRKRDLALTMTLGGPAVTVGAYLAFFGGSERDPEWVWAGFYLCVFGGLAAGVIGLIWLLILASESPT